MKYSTQIQGSEIKSRVVFFQIGIVIPVRYKMPGYRALQRVVAWHIFHNGIVLILGIVSPGYLGIGGTGVIPHTRGLVDPT